MRDSAEIPYHRERWRTPDDDFLDLDFLQNGHNRLAIIGHGLEGNSSRPYITHTAALLSKSGWDVCAWNSRSCSGEMNLQPKLYSHADISDLEFIIQNTSQKYAYKEIALIGFSMGGAIILNYLSKRNNALPDTVKAAVAISTPLDIKASSIVLSKGINKYYTNYFMGRLKQKVNRKAEQYPALLSIDNIDEIRGWRVFDEQISAPLGGYESADDFYFHCSAKHRIHRIQTPTLLINAKDDPMLTKDSYPKDAIINNDKLFALYPDKGGHVAFLQRNSPYSYAEKKALEFVEAILDGQIESFLKQFEKS